ncbi:DNA-binding protein [Streptomyces sp. NPDC057199]|uniref:DNA-binding protein n=1 Tax=Streptomyces sp. NPDC057199 TaxID=3346047 RepID=UPI003644FECD
MPNTGKVVDDVLTSAQVCEQYPSVFRNAQALADHRWRSTGPDFIKTAPGSAGRILYRRSAIERWLDEHTVTGGQRAA